MNALEVLPEGYREIYSVDLQKDKKMSVLVNGSAFAIAAVMAVVMHFFVPFDTIYDGDFTIVKLWAALIGSVAYMVLHELVHGIAMKICGTQKVKYGFTGLYAFAGSKDYYPLKPYIFIALAPIVVWGVVLAIINAFVPLEWFWVVYLIQIINISGAAGDLFVSVKFSRLPKDILVQDYGVGMTVYSRK